MKKILIIVMARGFVLLNPLPILAQHFVPVYESVYQPMNIIVDAATIDGINLEAGDEIGIYDLTATGDEICVGAAVLSGPILAGAPFPVVASSDDPLTIDQDGFIDGNTILYRFWDSSEAIELICVTMTYNTGFDQVFVSLGTALGSLTGIYTATADAGIDGETCEDAPYTLAGTATNQQSVLWETSGDGTFDNAASLTATYTPGATDITNGSATLTLTAYAVSPCAAHGVDDMLLSIQALPAADAGMDDFVCEDASYTLSGIASNQVSILWTTVGDGSFDDPTLLSATYTPGTTDISNGSVVLSLTSYAILPCGTDATDDMLLSIQMLPTVNAGDDAEICSNDTYTLSGSATDYSAVLWTTSGDGTFDDATLLNATYTPGTGDINTGSANLTLTAEAEAPCGIDAVDGIVLTIQGMATANAGSDAIICEDETHMLSGIATNQSSVLWSTAGDGSFNDPTLLNASYTPGANDISNGSVQLTLTANAISPCSTTAVDGMELSIDPLPGVPNTPDGPVMVDIHLTPTSDYETQTVAGATNYAWTLSPSSAGNIAGSGITATVTWTPAFHGFAYVKVTAMNNCGAAPSDSLEVEVTNSVGMEESLLDRLDVSIIPNPNSGSFILNIKTLNVI